jgi:hypothetical protein
MTDQSPTEPAQNPAAAAVQLSPPAETATLTLAPPEPVAAVAPAASASMVPLDAAALPGLDKMGASSSTVS